MAQKRNNFIRFLGYVRPYSGYLVLAVLGGIVKFTVPLLTPQVTRYLVDQVFLNATLPSEEKMRQLLLCTGAMAAVYLFLYAPFVYIRHIYADKASHRAVFHLRYELYWRILRLSASFFSRHRSGEIVSRLISDIALAQNLVGTALTNTWMDAAALIAILFFVFRIDMPTALAALATYPVYLFFFRRFSTSIRAATMRIQDELATMAGDVSERISATAVIHAFGREKTEKRRFRRQSEKLFSINMQRILMQGLNQAVTGTLIGLAPLVVIAFGGMRVLKGAMTVGDLVALMMYLGPLYLPMQRFSELNVVMANALAALDRIFQIMDEQPDIRSRPDAVDLPSVQGRVEFEHVWFGYQPDRPVLQDIHFTVEPGSRIALVGPSGSGKSTLVSLIPRFYDVQSGAVRIDGIDVRDLKVSSLRKAVGMVLQEPMLFSGTIRENILYGNPSASDQEVIEAAKAAHALEFIQALPAGFDTEVGERGLMLSGGQKQRITIARAFLKNPPILIFDEATSSLDSESEYWIQQAMQNLIRGRTTFIIAHRLATVIHADWILVLQNGRIVEQGTHLQLVSQNGIYRDFFRRQMQSAQLDLLVDSPFLNSDIS
ncbi:MAG TPA: ABC transporter ATP-binding protein [Anaerohalosphaeraceae bacterium]|nr:ABC transporter ATP-binding protein [Anaerohalosphaeraceae bacterium]